LLGFSSPQKPRIYPFRGGNFEAKEAKIRVERVQLVRRTLEGSPRQVLHIRARDLLVANLQTSGAVLSKPAGRQRSLLKEHSA